MSDRTTAFARAIVAGAMVAGEYEIAAYQRHLADIEDGAQGPPDSPRD
jgi:hypothetical protein